MYGGKVWCDRIGAVKILLMALVAQKVGLNDFLHVLKIFLSEMENKNTNITNISIFMANMQNIIFIMDLSEFNENVFLLENAQYVFIIQTHIICFIL